MPLVGEPPGRQERDSPLTPCGAWLPLLTGYSNHTLKGQIWPFVFETSWQGVHSLPSRDRLPRSVHLVRSVVVDEHRSHVALFPVDSDLTGERLALLGRRVLAVVAVHIRDVVDAVTSGRVRDDTLDCFLSLVDVEHVAVEHAEPQQAQYECQRHDDSQEHPACDQQPTFRLVGCPGGVGGPRAVRSRVAVLAGLLGILRVVAALLPWLRRGLLS